MSGLWTAFRGCKAGLAIPLFRGFSGNAAELPPLRSLSLLKWIDIHLKLYDLHNVASCHIIAKHDSTNFSQHSSAQTEWSSWQFSKVPPLSEYSTYEHRR